MLHFSIELFHNRIQNPFHTTNSRYNRTKIRWSKNSKPIGKNKNLKTSKKGALRILEATYRDAGVFGCHAGLSTSELRLKIKPKPGDREPTPADYEALEYGEEEEEEDEDNETEIHENEGKLSRRHRPLIRLNNFKFVFLVHSHKR